MPYPGSEIYKSGLKGGGGLINMDQDWSKYGKQLGGAVELREMNINEIKKLQLKGYLICHATPRKMLNITRRLNMKFLPYYLMNIIVSRLGKAFR